MTKKLIPLLFVIAILFQGCKGDDGAPGVDGGTVLGTTFDITKVNFTSANKYVTSYTFAATSPNVKVLESDLVLVYILLGPGCAWKCAGRMALNAANHIMTLV